MAHLFRFGQVFSIQYQLFSCMTSDQFSILRALALKPCRHSVVPCTHYSYSRLNFQQGRTPAIQQRSHTYITGWLLT